MGTMTEFELGLWVMIASNIIFLIIGHLGGTYLERSRHKHD